jgi:hypothetical protein
MRPQAEFDCRTCCLHTVARPAGWFLRGIIRGGTGEAMVDRSMGNAISVASVDDGC